MVTSSPVPFKALPRQTGESTTHTVNADTPFAAGIDANFTALNAYLLSSWNPRFTVTKVPSILTFNPNVTWHTTDRYCDGLLNGPLRILECRLKWQGATLDPDGFGGVPDQTLGTLKDSRFLPGGDQALTFVGSAQNQLAIFYLTASGTLVLTGLSSPGGSLTAGMEIYFNFAFLPYVPPTVAA